METLSSDKVFFYCIFAELNRKFSFGCIRKNRNRDVGMEPSGFVLPLKEIEFTDEKEEERYNS